MSIRKNLLNFIFLPLVISVTNDSSVNVETKVKSEVSGDNTSVETKIINNINDKKTEVISSQAGEVKISIKEDKLETKIITPFPSSIKTILPSPFISEKVIKEEFINFQNQIQTLIKHFINTILELFNFSS